MRIALVSIQDATKDKHVQFLIAAEAKKEAEEQSVASTYGLRPPNIKARAMDQC